MPNLSYIESRGGSAGRVASAFRAAVRGARLGQTYLIYGPSGAGKEELGRAVAAAAACLSGEATGDACGRCNSCLAGQRGAEADFSILAPLEGKREILIDQVRTACADLTLAPMVGRARVLLVVGADGLREEAANAFLKTLEEPPESSLVILLTARVDGVLPTIRSRSLEVRLAPLAPPASAGDDAGSLDEEATADALAIGAAALFLDASAGPFDQAGRAFAALERIASAAEGEATKTERTRRAALVVIDRLLSRLRGRLRERALSSAPILDVEAAVEAATRAAQRTLANATPKLVLEVLAIDIARARVLAGSAP